MDTTNVSKCFSSSKYGDDSLGSLAQHVIASMGGNSRFATPDPTLVVLQTATTSFVNAVAKAIGGTKQDTADKNAKREILEDLLRKEADYVQRTSGGVEVSILSSGFDVYKKPEPVGALPMPNNFKVKAGPNRGCIEVSCDAVNKAEFYEFEYIDTAIKDGAVWIKKTGTKRRLLIDGLTSGKEYAFRAAAAGSDPTRRWTGELTSFVL